MRFTPRPAPPRSTSALRLPLALRVALHPFGLATFLLTASVAPLFADTPASSFQRPPDAVATVVDAPAAPALFLSPDRTFAALLSRPGYPNLADLAQPELRLAGLRFSPANQAPTRTTSYDGLTFRRFADLHDTPVTGLPPSPRLGSPRFSPDGQHLAFTLTQPDQVQLWVASTSTGQARRLGSDALNLVLSPAFSWLPDSSGLLALITPPDHPPAPTPQPVPFGPSIQETSGRTAAARTYQDLLRSADDDRLFTHHATSQPAELLLDDTRRLLAPPDLYLNATPSPDNRWLLLATVRPPFSRLVPASSFARLIQVLPRDGSPPLLVADLPAAEEVPPLRNAVRPGRRLVSWRADAPATLLLVEARDGGDPRQNVPVRDALLLWPAPFDSAPTTFAELSLRYNGIDWGDDQLALVYETWWRDRRQRVWTVAPSAPASPPRLLFDYSTQNRYAHPGSPLQQPNAAGLLQLLRDPDGHLFLTGEGAREDGDRPFLDRLDPATHQRTRLFESPSDAYEYPTALLDPGTGLLLTRRETPDTPPNHFLHAPNLPSPLAFTDHPHPYPHLAAIQKEQIRFPREDGVMLTATLYLPPGHRPGDAPLPTLVWAYPREFVSAADAGQTSGSPHRFIALNPNRAIWLAALGYAVIDDASMPIVGTDGQEPNDTFANQLVMNARAIVDEAVRRGITDPARVAVAGHSYGAFMTANLLVYSDLFRTGIARSGAYNRTLTPFGFQAEQRTFWQAPEVYHAMSPFSQAHRLTLPLLLIHGNADNNSGTFPLQSERLYAALKGLGTTARLVMLPHESHGYAARESLLHVMWETHTWLQTHLAP